MFQLNHALLKKAANITAGNYGRPNAMRDYLYLRVSQKEPFDILYFTPSITGILNISDKSFSPVSRISVCRHNKPRAQAEGFVHIRERLSDYGEKQND